jgi:hypothetical protein
MNSESAREFNRQLLDAALPEMLDQELTEWEAMLSAYVGAKIDDRTTEFVRTLLQDVTASMGLPATYNTTPTDGITARELEAMFATAPRPAWNGVVVPSKHCMEQFRFPKSKKKRIRNKWAKRPENWRPMRTALLTPEALYCHPALLRHFTR